MLINLFIILTALISIIMVFYVQHLVRIALVPKKLILAKNLQSRDEEKAVEILTKVLSIDRGNPDANWMLSGINLNRKHFVLSLMFLHDMLKNNRYTPEIQEQDVRESLARIYLIMGNVEKAIEQFNTMSRKWVLPASLIKQAVKIQIDGGLYIEAKKLIKEGIMLYPLDGEFSYMSGQVSYISKDYLVAESKLVEAERKNFFSEQIDLMLARIYFNGKMYDKSIERLKKIDVNDDPKSGLMMAECYYHMNNFMSANEIFGQIEKRTSADNDWFSELKYFFASSLEMIGKVDDALGRWREVYESDPHYSEAMDKVYVYTQILCDVLSRRLLICSETLFVSASQMLAGMLDYAVKKVLYQDDKAVYILCMNKRDSRMFNEYMLAVLRDAKSVSVEDMNVLLNRQRIYNVEHMSVVAPYFSEEALSFCAEKSVSVYGFDLFRKHGILQKVLSVSEA